MIYGDIIGKHARRSSTVDNDINTFPALFAPIIPMGPSIVFRIGNDVQRSSARGPRGRATSGPER